VTISREADRPLEPTVAVVIVSRNEGALLRGCLERATWADEIVVLDMESTDETGAIGEAFGARVLRVPLRPVVEQVRQHGIDAVSSDWLLFLDPDERLPDGFASAIRPYLRDPSVDAYMLEFRDHAFGKPLFYVSAGGAKIALLRPSKVTYPHDAVAHQPPIVEGTTTSLRGTIPVIDHLRIRSVGEAAEKVARYGSSGGVATPGLSVLDAWVLPKLLFRQIIVGQAWRDGRPGVAAACISSISEYLGVLRQWEHAGAPDPPLSARARAVLSTLAVLRRASRWLRVRNH